MKILIISDTHGDTEIIKKIRDKHKDVDIILHAGDSELPPYMTNDFLCVKGNCDYYDYPVSRDLNIEGFMIHIEHGNRIRIPVSLFLENNSYNIVIFGHTHSLKIIENISENKYFFNPGSLVKPRDSNKGSYIILSLKDGNIIHEEHRIEIF